MTETQVAKTYLKTMTCAKTYIFTVTNSENCNKPIEWAQMTTDKAVNDQKTAEKLIRDWAAEYFEDGECEDELEDLAYSMRKDGYAWFQETYCFELTEVNG